MEALRISACLCSFVSLVLLIIALASDHWITSSDGSYGGLWKACGIFCLNYGMDVQDYIHATRAFLFIAMFAGAVSFFGLCASFSRTHLGSMSIKGIAVTTSLVAGACSLIAMATFTGVYNERNVFGNSFGWSFGLGWVSFPLFLIAGGLAYMTASTSTS